MEDPVVEFLENGSSRLVDGHFDVMWIGHREIVEAAIPALSVLVLFLNMRRLSGISNLPVSL